MEDLHKTMKTTMTMERLPFFLLGYMKQFNEQRPLDRYSKKELIDHIRSVFYYVQTACDTINEEATTDPKQKGI